MSDGTAITIPISEGLFHLPEDPHSPPSLLGSRCASCGYVAFPRRPICPACLSREVEEAHVGQRARLESFAVARQAPPGFTAPYVQALVRLDEGPLVFTLVTGCEPRDDALSVGQEMELVIEPLRQDERGNAVLAWKYRPVLARAPVPFPLPSQGRGQGIGGPWKS